MERAVESHRDQPDVHQAVSTVFHPRAVCIGPSCPGKKVPDSQTDGHLLENQFKLGRLNSESCSGASAWPPRRPPSASSTP